MVDELEGLLDELVWLDVDVGLVGVSSPAPSLWEQPAKNRLVAAIMEIAYFMRPPFRRWRSKFLEP